MKVIFLLESGNICSLDSLASKFTFVLVLAAQASTSLAVHQMSVTEQNTTLPLKSQALCARACVCVVMSEHHMSTFDDLKTRTNGL